MDQHERIAYLLALKDQGLPVVVIERQYGVSRSTLYYWLSRYEIYYTYENLSRAPHQIYGKITEEIKAAVLDKHHKNPRLGCWRLSLFDYEGQKLGPTTIWLIIMEARQPRLPPRFLYHLTHTYQIWFIDHMHLRTLSDGQKVYSLVVLDGFSRVLLSDEICLSKGARDACLILLRAFARWGLPEEIVSDNGGAFISLLYRLFLGVLRVKVSYTHLVVPGKIRMLSLSLARFALISIHIYNVRERPQGFSGYIQRKPTNTITGCIGSSEMMRSKLHWASWVLKRDARCQRTLNCVSWQQASDSLVLWMDRAEYRGSDIAYVCGWN